MLENGVERLGDEAADGAKRWLNIRVEESIHSIPAEEVIEISPPRVATRIPGAPGSIIGLINHRGSVVTVVDLGRLLGRPRLSEPEHRLVLVRRGAHLVALATSDILGFGDPIDVTTGEPTTQIDLDELLRGVL